MRLALPPTLSFPKREDAPPHVDLDALDRAREAACIEPGYLLVRPEDTSKFDFHAIVNVDIGDLWREFETLVQRLPEPTAAIVNERDLDPYLGAYVPTERLMPILRLFRTELVNDSFLEFGVIHGTPEGTHEVFVTYAKYLKVWGRDLEAFRESMAELGLPERPELKTINRFPLVMTALNHVIAGAAHHGETIERLTDRLSVLEED